MRMKIKTKAQQQQQCKIRTNQKVKQNPFIFG